jgi:endonuclease/exonuclease/phosphatase family metal-dependent hydrolase
VPDVHAHGHRSERCERSRRHGLLLALNACLIVSCLAILPIATAETASAPASLKLATWNLEWLIAPAQFRLLKTNCIPQGAPAAGSERRIPCDVAARFERSARDFDALATYARELNADVIALQEVDGPQAARLVLPDYEFCFTGRRHPQNNGFAIRKGLPYRCAPDVFGLAPRDALRRGSAVVLYPGTPAEMHLLSVHLKSGCARDALDSPSKACRDLAAQVPALEAWIDVHAHAGRRFGVLGDFNRDLLNEPGRVGLWPQLDDADPPESNLVNAAEGMPFQGCVPGAPYKSYIDFIVLSQGLAARMVPGSFQRIVYSAKSARRSRLSDHCPVAVRVSLPRLS